MTRLRWLLPLLLMATCASFDAQGQLAIDKTVSFDTTPASGYAVAPAFSTSAANELLLVFVELPANNNQHVLSMAGSGCGGITFTFVKRTNTQTGAAEIWKAFATNKVSSCVVTATIFGFTVSSITVSSLTGASATIGATASANSASGAPSVTLQTTKNGSWVLGNGNGHGAARTVPGNQTLVHEYRYGTGSGIDLWVQRLSSTTANSGTPVTLNDTAPTTYPWNLTAVEVLPAAGITKTLSSVSVTPATATATIGGSPVQFAATAHYSDSSTADVTTTASWTSSTGAATVGLHTGTATGVTTTGSPTTITASYTENSVTKTNTAVLTVKAAPYVSLAWAEGKPDTPPTTYAPQRGLGACPIGQSGMTNLVNSIAPTSYQDNGPFVKGQAYCYDVTETDSTNRKSGPSNQVSVTPYP